MTSQPETPSDLRISFENELDSLPLQRADAVLVLRNHDKDETAARVEVGIELLANYWAPVMLLTFSEHTRAEAIATIDMMVDLRWSSVILVTHKYHSYRAYLTFIQTFKGSSIRLYMKSVPSGIELAERAKITQYSGIGDCATYREGLDYIKWISKSMLVH